MDEEIEFCKECGMEFPDGLEDTCPLCGNELGLDDDEEDDDVFVVGKQLDDSERCAECGEWYDDEDEWFWDYWTDFDGPDWLSIDDVWCFDCILKRFKKDNPDFEASGLEPDTYLIWKEALGMGIDLGPNLFDIEMSNAIRRLRNSDREKIIGWLNSDCSIDDAEEWTMLFDEVEEALAWRDAGFSPDESRDWADWECTAAEAAAARDAGDGFCPDLDFKKFGFGFKDAAFLNNQDFEPYEDEGPECYIGTWLPSGLTLPEIVRLRTELTNRRDVFDNLHRQSQTRLKYEERTDDIWEALPVQFEELKATGLAVNTANLEKYWGLKSKEILKAIDAGGALGVAASVIRQGGSVSKLGMIERLLDLGLGQPSATLIAQRGLLVKHLKQIEKNGNTHASLRWLAQALETDSSLRVEEAMVWLEAESTVSQVKAWRAHGFSAQDAAKWSNEGFQPDLASRWRDSGVSSPTVAKRRRDAGLYP
jgi:hypothetical protein